MDNDESGFAVGYKKPPVETRFKAGQSGNPGGRPKKKTSTFAETVERELNTSVTVTEGGKPKRISKLDAIVKHQTIKAVQGDHKAIAFVMRAVEPREVEPKDNLSPMLMELRAIHEQHEILALNGTRKQMIPHTNEQTENYEDRQ